MENITTPQVLVNAAAAIKATSGKFAKVIYRRKDGEQKSYTIRTGVKKYVVGVGKFTVPNSVTVYSVTAGNKGYKTFLLDGIKSVKCGNTIM